MHPHMHGGEGKRGWEGFHWDQDVGRWVGPRRDEFPSNRVRPGHDDGNDRGPGLLD